jgi:hypothetical protein
MQFDMTGTHGEYNDSDYFNARREFKVETLGEAVGHIEMFLKSLGYNFDHLEVRNDSTPPRAECKF